MLHKTKFKKVLWAGVDYMFPMELACGWRMLGGCGLHVFKVIGMCMEGDIGLCDWHVDIYRWLGVDVHLFSV